LVAAGAIAAVALGGSDGDASGAGDSEARPFEPERGAVDGRFPSDPESARHHPVAHLRGSRLLYDRPGGKPIIRIAGETQWNSPRVLAVVKRRGRWVAVLAPELKNGKVGWMRMRDVTTFDTVSWSLHADLSRRRLEVRRGGKTVRRMTVGVGRAGHATPKGRFAVTDRLKVRDPGSPYGCCVLALTGHQTRLPPGWPGGDRLAVHATSDLAGLGNAVSLGCMRSHPRDARWLIKKVPLGSPVFIRG
ncbi:MAG: L,D-transpeptidase, partial [Actinomycetota bacterium]|nr:L,D-transpeptidase [Actinomycetota bacterium]